MTHSEILNLESARYAAMLAGDTTALRNLCSTRLRYTHSDGAQDRLESYLARVASGHFTYHDISHQVDWVEITADTALLGGRMAAHVNVAGESRHIDNAFLAAWTREEGGWKFLAYQPTPLKRRE